MYVKIGQMYQRKRPNIFKVTRTGITQLAHSKNENIVCFATFIWWTVYASNNDLPAFAKQIT
jgi:hypothetical protein